MIYIKSYKFKNRTIFSTYNTIHRSKRLHTKLYEFLNFLSIYKIKFKILIFYIKKNKQKNNTFDRKGENNALRLPTLLCTFI